MKKQTLIYMLMLIGLAACKNNNSTIQFKVLNEGLKRYDNVVKSRNMQVGTELKNKLDDPQTAAKAAIWQPKAAFMQASADSMNAYIGLLTGKLRKEAGLTDESDDRLADVNNSNAVKEVFETAGNAELFYHSLVSFNEKSLSVLNPDDFKDNPILEEDIKKAREQFRRFSPIREGMPVKEWFKNASVPAALALLSKLQNDVDNITNERLNYCNSMVSAITESFDVFRAIIVQNSSNLKAGQLLEITAGVGAFSVSRKSKITIDGKKIELDPEGVAEYKIKAPAKPGNYTIPVKIYYMTAWEKPDSVLRKIKYTVIE